MFSNLAIPVQNPCQLLKLRNEEFFLFFFLLKKKKDQQHTRTCPQVATLSLTTKMIFHIEAKYSIWKNKPRGCNLSYLHTTCAEKYNHGYGYPWVHTHPAFLQRHLMYVALIEYENSLPMTSIMGSLNWGIQSRKLPEKVQLLQSPVKEHNVKVQLLESLISNIMQGTIILS